jgi:phytoene dehydrogenase-like protein
MKAVIIGSGMAGLTAAAYLVKFGHEVTICEQFDRIGGVTAPFEADGFRWDLGPLLLEKFEECGEAYAILKELGIGEAVQRLPDDRSIAFPDFMLCKPDRYQGPLWRRELLKQLFPKDAVGIDAYYRFYGHLMAIIAFSRKKDMGIRTDLSEKIGMLYHQLSVKKFVDWSAEQLLENFFSDEKLRAVFSGILGDFCVLPGEFPGLAVPWCNVETAFEKRILLEKNRPYQYMQYCYIKNGTGSLVDAFADFIRSNGGSILTGCKAVKVITEHNIVRGVQLSDGTVVPADMVLASGGARDIFYDLVGKEQLTAQYRKSIEQARPMESVLMVHLGVDFDPGVYQKQALCYYYGTYDVSGAVQRCRNGIFNGGDDGFLIYIPTMHSPEMAPDGHHAITIYTIAPNTLIEGDWETDGRLFADRLIANAEERLPGLRDHIVTRHDMTPVDFQRRTCLRHHGFGGMVPVMGKTNPSHITPVQNLFFIGAQSESGGGVAGVMLGVRKFVLHTLIGQN